MSVKPREERCILAGAPLFFTTLGAGVQEWLGHESLATTQKYLDPSKETEKQLEEMKLPF
jgi:integrase